MKKIFVVFVLAGFLVSCQLQPKNVVQEGAQGSVLALTTGGTLSADDANDRDPFVFVDSDGQSKILFASDRGGNYDLYFAKMLTNGVFEPPVRLGTNVNTSEDEMSPVITSVNGALRLAWLRNETLYTADISADLQNISNETMIEISVGSNISVTPSGDLLSFFGSTIQEFSYSSSYGWDFREDVSVPFDINSVSGYTNRYGTIYLVEIVTNGRHQLSGGAKISAFGGNTNFTMWFALPEYASTNNDITPFIDHIHGNQVYFASDRYGRGYYDLYRYNTQVYDAGETNLFTLHQNTLLTVAFSNLYTVFPSIIIEGTYSVGAYDTPLSLNVVKVDDPTTNYLITNFSGLRSGSWATESFMLNANSTNVFVVTFITSDGYTNIQTNRVIHDSSPPAFTITSPTNNQLTGDGNVVLSGVVSDVFSPSNNLFVVNSVVIGTNTYSTTNFSLWFANGQNFSTNLVLEFLDVTNSLYIYALDSAGNASASTQITVLNTNS